MTGMLSRLSPLVAARDVGLSAVLLLSVTLMIIPMPTVLVDGFIAFNFAVAILLIMTSIYLKDTLALSSLPGIILISTIFRLSLSVTTTRLILGQGDAGTIVESFGRFVISGNLVVGLVIFFIVTIVQFMVISKGAERIAEVGARFTLDGLPGKQMAIDAELRNGDIDAEEATARRSRLQQESQFFGSMDGAMKFVKGDSIAGLIIILVNLIGGVTIGMMQLGMTMGDAIGLYALLSVGDALISQIPALLIALSAASIVTRVQGNEESSMSADIVAQLGADHRAVGLAAGAVMLMGLVPGFPTMTLGGIAVLLGIGAYFIWKTNRDRAPEGEGMAGEAAPDAPASEATDEGADGAEDTRPIPEDGAIVLHVTPGLLARLDDARQRHLAFELPAQLEAYFGLPIAPFGLRQAEAIGQEMAKVVVLGEPIAAVIAHEGFVSVAKDRAFLPACDIPEDDALDADEPDHKRIYVHDTHCGTLDEMEISYLDDLDQVIQDLTEIARLNVYRTVGFEESQAFQQSLGEDHAALVEQVFQRLSPQIFGTVVRKLMADGVSLANRRLFLEALYEWGDPSRAPEDIAEFVRIAFRRQICDQLADENRVIGALIFDDRTERTLSQAMSETVLGRVLVLSSAQNDALVGHVAEAAERITTGKRPIIFTSVEMRRHLKAYLSTRNVAVDVMSYPELVEGYTLVPTATLRLPEQ